MLSMEELAAGAGAANALPKLKPAVLGLGAVLCLAEGAGKALAAELDWAAAPKEKPAVATGRVLPNAEGAAALADVVWVQEPKAGVALEEVLVPNENPVEVLPNAGMLGVPKVEAAVVVWPPKLKVVAAALPPKGKGATAAG